MGDIVMGDIVMGDIVMGDIKGMLGSGGADERNHHDYYPTPPLMTQALLDREKFPGVVWEPACGEYHMSKVLVDNKYIVKATDLIYGYDFLTATDDTCGSVVTNPPFSLAMDFWKKCIDLKIQKYAFLLRLQFLEGSKRYDLFKGGHNPKKVYVFSDMMNVNHAGLENPFGGLLCFCWFVWERGYVGDTSIDWIKFDKKQELEKN
jgi:hypothetical protein